MGEVLSQDEVKALLRGVSEGSVPGATGAQGTPAVRPCDLTAQERALYGRLPGLDRVFDVFIRNLRGTVEGILGDIGGLSLSGVELLRYGSWTQRFPRAHSVHMFRLAPLHGNGLLILSPTLAAAALEVSFGGKTRRSKPIEEREYSLIETRVLQRFVVRVLGDFQDAWQIIEPLELSIVRSESHLSHAVVATDDSVALVAEVRILLESEEGLSLTVCVPYGALDPLRAKLAGEIDTPTDDRGPSWAGQMRERVEDVSVGLTVELGNCRLSLRKLVALKEGDLLVLETRKDQPVVVRVEGLPKFYGMPGLARSGHAVRILGRIGGRRAAA
jgi:flagellar motor switch protein FliM